MKLLGPPTPHLGVGMSGILRNTLESVFLGRFFRLTLPPRRVLPDSAFWRCGGGAGAVVGALGGTSSPDSQFLGCLEA